MIEGLPQNAWLTDRSRIALGDDHCQMARYYEYHYQGTGIVPVAPSLNTSIGIAVHDMLAEELARTETRDDIDTVWTERFVKWSERIYKVCELRRETQHTKNEAAWLASVLAYGWWTQFAAWFAERFEIIAIEREYALVLDDGRIVIQVKPDLVLRDRQTGKLCIMDFKSMSSFKEQTTPQSFAESVQIALMTAAVEAAHGEPVEQFWIAGMVKGSKQVFEKDGNKTAEPRFYSHLCYAKVPQPPFKEWDFKGFWYNKTPIWEFDPSPINFVRLLQEKRPDILHESFPMMGPFQRQTHMIPQALRGIVGGENRWINALWALSEANPESFNVVLDETFSRSYGNCTSFFGDSCPFVRLCYALPGHEDPIGSGFYRQRRPHHEPERQDWLRRGIPLPLEPWDEQVAPATAAR